MLSHGFMLARHPQAKDTDKIIALTADEKQRLVNLLAELDHNSWLGRKLMAGWTYAPGDPDHKNKTHPGMMMLSDPRAVGVSGCSLKSFRTGEAKRFVEHLSDRKHRFYAYFTTPLQDLYAFPGLGQAQQNQLKHMHVLYPDGNFHNGRTSQLLATWLGCDQHDALKQLAQSPYFALFIWAIISKRLMLARMLLEVEPDKAFVRALVGSVVCEALYNQLSATSWIASEEIASYRDSSEWFVGIAKRVIAESSRQDFVATKNMVQAAYPDSCGLPLYKLAYTVNYYTQESARNFWTNEATSALLDDLWYGGIVQNNSWLKVAIGVVFPPYVALWVLPQRVQWTELEVATWGFIRMLSLELAVDHHARPQRGGIFSHLGVRGFCAISVLQSRASCASQCSEHAVQCVHVGACPCCVLTAAFGPIYADITSPRHDTQAFSGRRS